MYGKNLNLGWKQSEHKAPWGNVEVIEYRKATWTEIGLMVVGIAFVLFIGGLAI